MLTSQRTHYRTEDGERQSCMWRLKGLERLRAHGRSGTGWLQSWFPMDKYINVGGKRQKDTLSQATSLSAGLLQEAAEMKEDFSILLHIKDKDRVALEVRYHKTCYRDYTRFLSKTASKAEEENEPAFDASYKIFCERVIRQRLIVNHEVLKMNS
ncbi:hypothetical protein AAFF_G00083910 [Aldrovandia affinis]|uniref:Uncharacterized protein n=1 Tax=Aldrovandia affinis TaxID=143900 RepID=A0AAD7WCW0_9TELE|nr:hypothetical protein AAFF_G00083910 [Aldrovandia affinis]